MYKIEKSKSLFNKLFLYFMGVSLIPTILLGVFILLFSNKISVNNIRSLLQTATTSATENMDILLEEYKNALNLFCQDEEMMQALSLGRSKKNSNIIYQKMYLLLAGRSLPFEMYVIREDNAFAVATSAIPKKYNPIKYKEWGLFREISQRQYPIVYPNRYVNPMGKKIGLSMARCIFDGDKLLGYVIIDIPEETIATTLHLSDGTLPVDYTIMDKRFYIVYDEIFKQEKLAFLNVPFREDFYYKKMHANDYNIKDKRMQITNQGLPNTPLNIIGAVPIDLMLQNNNYIALITAILGMIGVILCFIASLILSKSVTKPIQSICKVMECVEKGDMTAKVNIKCTDEIGIMGCQFNKMILKLDQLFKNNLEKQDCLRLAEIENLQSQINPHFLYNTLDSIKWLAKLNQSKDIITIVSQIGILLKNSINNKQDMITVEESIKVIKSYLAIQTIRYPDKFDTCIEIEPSILQARLPKLIIQPIVENAVAHGIENKVGHCILKIRGWGEQEKLIFEIEDDGIGIEPAILARLQKVDKSQGLDAKHVGIRNVNRRIKLCYGNKYGLKIESEVGVGTIVTLTMPNEDRGGCKHV